jgi:hypothetical protein
MLSMSIFEEFPLKLNGVEAVFTSTFQKHCMGPKILHIKIMCSKYKVAGIVMIKTLNE